MSAIYSSTFIFAKGRYDDAFHALDAEIAEMARGIPGYLGEEAWDNAATGLVSNVYYWNSLAALQQLMTHPSHQQAKARQGDWLAGYRVVISQVLRTYGDEQLDDRLPALGDPGRLGRYEADRANAAEPALPGRWCRPLGAAVRP